jgi:hypothetical protein
MKIGFINSKGYALAVVLGLSATAPAMAQMYVEGSVGIVSVDDVSTVPYSGSAGGFTFTNLRGTVGYDNSTAYGLEIGYYISPMVRVGLGYNRFSLDWETITVGAGSISDGTTTVSGSGTVTRGQLAGDSSFDNDVSTLMVNLYADIPTTGPMTAFLGVGFGQADISNARDDEDALAFMLGANYDLGSNNYIGAKYTHYDVDGPTDKLGLDYEDVSADVFSITFGHRF